MNILNRVFSLLLLILFLSGCREADIRLINKVKTFGPQWSTLNEKVNYFERNVEEAEEKLETDYKQLEGLMDQIPDSLRGREYRTMLKEYDFIIVLRDSVRQIFDAAKEEYRSNRSEFNDWEQQVMAGEVDLETGLSKLENYKETHQRLDSTVDHITQDLEQVFGTHNRVLRKLSEYMDIHSNYDIKMQ